MKIAFLTSEYPHLNTGGSGGIGTSIKNLAKGLVLKGHQVRVLVYGQKKDATFNDGDVVIQQIKNIKVKGLSWYFTRKKIEHIINELYKNNEIDIVEAPDWTGITSFIQPKKCPIVIKLNGSDTYFCHLDKRNVKWWNRFHEKRALFKADGHSSVSIYTANLTNTLFKLKLNFSIIHNAVDVDSFSSIINKEIDKPIILYFGTLIPKKGLLELPLIFNKVVEQFPQAQLHLVGGDSPDIMSGSSSTWALMQKLFSDAALKKTAYHGKVAYSEMQTKIKEATVCVFPTFAEALPVSWLEAMAMQKAVVASDIGWGPEVIEHSVSGILVHPKDHQKYADYIVEVLQNGNFRNKLGENARKRVEEKFNSETIAQQNIVFYQSIINKK